MIGFLKEKKMKVLIGIIVGIIICLTIAVVAISTNKYSEYEKGVYLRKQVGQLVLNDDSSIQFSFYSVKNENYDFLKWNAILIGENNNILTKGNEVNVIQTTNLYKKIILTLKIDDVNEGADYLNQIRFSRDNEEISVDLGKLYICMLDDEIIIPNTLSISYTATLFDYNFQMNFENLTSNKIKFKGVLIGEEEFLVDKELDSNENVDIEFSFEKSVNENPNCDIVFRPLIKFDYNGIACIRFNPSVSSYTNLIDENSILEFLKTTNSIYKQV